MDVSWTIKANLEFGQLADGIDLPRHQNPVAMHGDPDAAFDEPLHDLVHVPMGQRIGVWRSQYLQARLQSQVTSNVRLRGYDRIPSRAIAPLAITEGCTISKFMFTFIASNPQH